MTNLKSVIQDLIAGAKAIDRFVCIRELREYVAQKFPNASDKQIEQIAWKLTNYVEPYLAGVHFIIASKNWKRLEDENLVREFNRLLAKSKLQFINWEIIEAWEDEDDSEMMVYTIEAPHEICFMEKEELDQNYELVFNIIKKAFKFKSGEIDFDAYKQ